MCSPEEIKAMYAGKLNIPLPPRRRKTRPGELAALIAKAIEREAKRRGQ